MTKYHCKADWMGDCLAPDKTREVCLGKTTNCENYVVWLEQSKKYMKGKAKEGRKAKQSLVGGESYIVRDGKGKRWYNVKFLGQRGIGK